MDGRAIHRESPVEERIMPIYQCPQWLLPVTWSGIRDFPK